MTDKIVCELTIWDELNPEQEWIKETVEVDNHSVSEIMNALSAKDWLFYDFLIRVATIETFNREVFVHIVGQGDMGHVTVINGTFME